jgi:hypothetical protein
VKVEIFFAHTGTKNDKKKTKGGLFRQALMLVAIICYLLIVICYYLLSISYTNKLHRAANSFYACMKNCTPLTTLGDMTVLSKSGKNPVLIYIVPYP